MVIEIHIEKAVGMDCALATADGKILGNTLVSLIQHGKTPIALNFDGIRSTSPRFLEGIVESLMENGIHAADIPSYVHIANHPGRQLLFDAAVNFIYDYAKRPDFYHKIWKECEDEGYW